MTKHKKHILNAAKDNLNNKYRLNLALIESNLNAAHTSHEGVFHGELDPCEICTKASLLKVEYDEVAKEWSEFLSQGKHNKKKLSRRVDWTADREIMPVKKVDHSALREFKSARREKNSTQVGVKWLYVGALVTKKNSTEMMIVTCISSGSAQVLDAGQEKWYRNTLLRPADWLLED